jgi:cytochrome c553
MTSPQASPEPPQRAPRSDRPASSRWSALAAGTATLVVALAAVDVSGGRASDTGAKAPILGGDVELGEYLSAECVTCHRLSGAYDGIPPIIGWPAEHFFAVMLEYRHKKRSNPVMRTIASKLSDEEIGALAAYFAQLTPQQ